MPQITHSFFFRNSLTCKRCCGSNPKRMEARVWKSLLDAKLRQEIEPFFGWRARHRICLNLAGGLKTAKQIHQFRVKVYRMQFAAFCVKRDGLPFGLNQDVGHGIEMGFHEAASMVARNQERVSKESPLRVIGDVLTGFNFSGNFFQGCEW